jgi:prepilin-type N-terminal cleavage/methylation domain-containing protein
MAFSLTEVLVTVTIIGILSAVAVPNYINSLNKGRQSDAATQVSQIQAGIQAYADEFLIGPSGWSELARVTPVITPTGVASGSSFTNINSAGGDYTISVTAASTTYQILASASKAGANWNIAACVNTASGASLLKRGNGIEPPLTPACL